MTAARKIRTAENEEGGADDIFRAIADPTRRAILDALRNGPQPVNAVAEAFPVSRPAISKHLRILREAGVVEETRHGRERLYRLKPAKLEPVDHWILTYRRFWAGHLNALKAFVETPDA
ncbi:MULTISPECIES: helix-turn-helix transcriptional regulator [Asticcacaulis]|uniref:ArsR/SmtB family transcription factor n=1 Tax=Asticcacaulis TaxID=76890 RepID=UPI001AEAB42B|nr:MULTISPECIES: metalloregulator ArsR/SmtB family transcription factor [Asticcacaulis]MBP2160215.1 DNA-binding transcriptional ArsR family regulator [Asticcacaulis solisilvae]MDR6801260.1 DNA-binding transcriptional ArsR family regulator [Asticcacaulis sp. BE141]